jgi:hypothetical protein
MQWFPGGSISGTKLDSRVNLSRVMSGVAFAIYVPLACLFLFM